MNKMISEMTFKQFRKRFDLKFISEEKILDIYNDKWRQNCVFIYPGKKGKEILKRFSEDFKGIHTEEIYKMYYATGNNGRDITISHNVYEDQVHYSSEFAGCGNGDYYLVANEKLLLFLERD